MKIAIEIDESRFKDIQRIAEVQIESSHFRTAEQIIAKGVPIEQEPILDKIRTEIKPKCDRINSLTSVLPYTAHREVQELLCEIMDLCKAEGSGE